MANEITTATAIKSLNSDAQFSIAHNEDGDVISSLNVGADTIAECDNYKGVISVETYK